MKIKAVLTVLLLSTVVGAVHYTGEFFIDGFYPTTNVGNIHGQTYPPGTLIQYHFDVDEMNMPSQFWSSGRVIQRIGEEECKGKIVSENSFTRENVRLSDSRVVRYYGKILTPLTSGKVVYDLCQQWIDGEVEYIATTWIYIREEAGFIGRIIERISRSIEELPVEPMPSLGEYLSSLR